MKKRRLSPEEEALWRRAMRRATPLEDRAPPPLSSVPERNDPARPNGAPRPKPVPCVDPPARPFRTVPQRETAMGGLDAATDRRLRRGRLDPEARIDLHGMRQVEARTALDGFIARAQERGHRCVLVITGKGGRTRDTEEADFMSPAREEGVLRRQVPLWLRQAPNAPRVYAVEPAHIRHGGGGAFYVFIRKWKE